MPKTKLDPNADVIYLAMKPDALEFFIQWAATPAALRDKDLKSQAKVAVHLGVTEQTIRNWKRDPRIASRIQAVSVGQLRIERYGSLLEAAYGQAMDPENPRSIQATKVLLEEMNRHSVDDVAHSDVAEMSITELKQLAADLYDELDDRSETG